MNEPKLLRSERFGGRELRIDRVDTGAGTSELLATLTNSDGILWSHTIPDDLLWTGSKAVVQWVEKERPKLLEQYAEGR